MLDVLPIEKPKTVEVDQAEYKELIDSKVKLDIIRNLLGKDNFIVTESDIRAILNIKED